MCVCWPHPSGLFGQNQKKEGGRKIQERRVLEKNGFSRDQREEERGKESEGRADNYIWKLFGTREGGK